VVDPRTRFRWYVLAAVVSFLYADAGHVAGALTGTAVTPLPAEELAFDFGVTLFVAGSLEEFGWRGFAQVRLHELHNATLVAALIGALWATWHVPLMMLGAGNFSSPADYVLMSIGISIVYGWLYNSTSGALPVVMVAHAASNMPGILRTTGAVPAVVEQLPVSPGAVFTLLVATVVVSYAGSEELVKDKLPEVPGRSEGRDAATAD
jgi:membrane protease YdiL (CAAX protease family)